MSRDENTGSEPRRASNSEAGYPWRIFWVLIVAAVLGYVALLPYLFQLFGSAIGAGDLPMPLPVFVVVQLMQAMILFGLVVGLGLLLARKVGLPMPLLRTWLYGDENTKGGDVLRGSAIIGIITGAILVALFIALFLPHLPAWPSEAAVPMWKRLLACFYGAVDEELLLRLFLLSLVLWLLQKMTHTGARAAPAAFWTANVVVGLIFAAAHLPAAKALMPLTPIVIVAVMSMNSLAGFVFGYLAWTRGIEAAIVAHFTSDLMLHFVGPLFTRA
jgi:hypothetical protein